MGAEVLLTRLDMAKSYSAYDQGLVAKIAADTLGAYFINELPGQLGCA